MGKKQFFDRINPVFCIDSPESVALYCKKNWPDDTAHAIRTADDVCENRFLFDFRWDMERTWETVTFEQEIDWSLIPFGDREFLWQFNRHRFLLCLGQAYAMTGNEKYASHYVRLLRDWIERVQEGDNIDLGPWRTLETGLRAECWMRSLCMVQNSSCVDEAFMTLVEECLVKHAQRLLNHFSEHKYISNWGVLEGCGLLLLSIACEGVERCTQYRETALKRLVHASKIQVLADGTQWEQSPMYHNEVYQCFRSAWYYGCRSGIEMPKELGETVKKMAYVNGMWKKPDHTQFTQGDSDASDLRDQITAGAWVVRDPVLKYLGYGKLDFESAWQFGYAACEEYERMSLQKPEFTSAELPFSGNYYFRSGWDEKDHLLHFHCGDTGGGHGHADKLHVDLVFGGEDVLVDAGRYTYVDGKDRFELKEPTGHNIVLADGEPFAVCDTSWIYKSLCSCIKQQFYVGKTGGFVEGTHLGYFEKGILMNRRIIWIYPDIYVITDQFDAAGKHDYETSFHFGREGKVSMTEHGVRFEGKEIECWLQTIDTPAERRILETRQSLHYNEVGTNRTYCEKISASGRAHRITVINGGCKGSVSPAVIETLPLHSVVHDRDIEAEDAEALKIVAGDKEYVLLQTFREVMTPTDILKCENCLGYGKAVLFDRSEEKEDVVSGEILAWW